MKHSSKFLFVLFFGLVAAACELAVDFDRSKIPTAAVDSSTITPIVVPDTGASTADSTAPDAAPTPDAASAADAAPTADAAVAADAEATVDAA